ncbi:MULTISPECIES: DEAD/DEAH box helicase [Paenibacillus]|uniref:DEAD/DEAH box helicase n=1 Tax=Paenibacillus TaxID=44249 RepID=UPI0011A462FE|nr:MULTISPECIES: DEAD/DEAH box helicase [Paenibacillus]
MNPTSFEATGIDRVWIDKLAEYGITEPSPVQAQAIPAVLRGADVLARSQTGTGKTLAYLLPVLQTIDPELKATQKLILAPTQELAMQIVREGEKYGEARGIGVLGLIGGAAVKRQVEKLRLHPELVVGTPGRVRELIEMRKLKMHHVSTIVVDEVDQVFQLGGAGDVDRILSSALRDRQLVFLSATVSESTAALVKREMRSPVEIGIDPDQTTAPGLEHLYVVAEERDRVDMLRRLIRQYNPQRAIVFVNQTESIAEVEAKLTHLGIAAEGLYGDADKLARSRVLGGFRHGRFKVLVASDVAARGLDIEGLELVINFDPAPDAEHYVHRAGRTGRMGRSGRVISIVTDRQTFIMRKFAGELGISLEPRVLYAGKVMTPEQFAARKGKGEPSGQPHQRQVRPSGSQAGIAEVRGSRQGDSKPAKGSVRGSSSPGEPREGGGRRDGRDTTRQGGEPFKGGKPAARQSQSERERIRKNKGAPKWLKNKPPRP